MAIRQYLLQAKVFHKGLILVGLPLLIELVLIGNLWMLLVKADKERSLENKYRIYSTIGARLMSLTYEMPVLLYSQMKSPNPKLIALYKGDYEQTVAFKKKMEQLAVNDAYAEDVIAESSQSLTAYLTIMESIASTGASGKGLEFLREISSLKARLSKIMDTGMSRIGLMSQFSLYGQKASERRIAEVRRLQMQILFGGLFLNLALGVLLYLFYKQSIMDRLARIKANTELLSKGGVLLPLVGGSDEIAQLDLSFHLMKKQLQESSEREQSLFENASDVICVLDRQGKFLRLNPACQKRWQLEPAALETKSVFDLVLPGESSKLERDLKEAMATEQAASFELALLSGNGELLQTLWSVLWSPSEERLFCVVHDISERKRSEKVKQEFLSMISYDLKRPLASMSSALASLLQNRASSNLPAQALDKLEIAKRNLARLLSLVTELLQVAQMDSAKVELNKEQCQIEDLLIRSVQDVEAAAEKQNLKIEIIQEPGEIELEADSNRIIQVLVNLLSNAAKFSKPGALVTVRTETKGDFLEISVIDRGRGVPESHKKLIFERFAQVEGADGKRKSGTGLGLPICKQIIEEHGGKIGLESKEGEGSRFWFSLPLPENANFLPIAQDENSGKSLPDEKIRLPATGPAEVQAFTGKDRKAELGLFQKGLVLVGVPLLFEVLFVWMLFVQLSYTEEVRQSELRQRRISASAGKMLSSYLKEGMLIAASKSEQNWEAFKSIYKELRDVRKELIALVASDPLAKQHFDRVEEYNRKCDRVFLNAQKIMEGEYSLAKHNRALEDRENLMSLVAVVARRLRLLIGDAEKKEFRPEMQAQIRWRQGTVIVLGLSTNLLASILLAFYFSKSMTSRLGLLADNAGRFAAEKPLNDPISGADEIAELDRSFHQTAAILAAARKKERSILDNSQDLICAMSKQGRFLSVNPALFTLLGYTKDEFLQLSLLEITAVEDKELTEKTLLASLQNADSQDAIYSGGNGVESRTMRKDGSLSYMFWSFGARQDKGEVYCIARDINAAKDLEKLKQEFLAMVSHDLRTPLTSISGVAKLVHAGAFGQVSAGDEEILSEIISESEHLLELINDLLDLEKLEAGKMQLLLQEEFLDRVLTHDLQRLLDGNAHSMPPLNFASELPPIKLSIDKDRFLQALSNLLKFLQSRKKDLTGEPEITVSELVADAAEAKKELQILLCSPGEPLSVDSCASLLDRFGSLDKASKGPSVGGLCLPIARSIIEAHGGRLNFLAREGTLMNCFDVRLPLGSNELRPD